MVFNTHMSKPKTKPGSVKRSITLPVELNDFVEAQAARTARARGNHLPNYSSALADIILVARGRAGAAPGNGQEQMANGKS